MSSSPRRIPDIVREFHVSGRTQCTATLKKRLQHRILWLNTGKGSFKFITHHYQKHKIPCQFAAKYIYTVKFKLFEACPIRSPVCEENGKIYLFHASPLGSGNKMYFRRCKACFRKQHMCSGNKKNLDSIGLGFAQANNYLILCLSFWALHAHFMFINYAPLLLPCPP